MFCKLFHGNSFYACQFDVLCKFWMNDEHLSRGHNADNVCASTELCESVHQIHSNSEH